MLPPHVNTLQGEEFQWSVIRLQTVALLAEPDISEELSLRSATFVDETPVLAAASTGEVGLDLPIVETIDLLRSLDRPNVDGTIYIKSQQELFEQAKPANRIGVEPRDLKGRLGSKQPKGLNIFELLLPVLLPPVGTEFTDELLFPEELYPFQRAGVKWLYENESALLADDMGLGKTVQAITAFRALIRRSKALHALVICPKAVLTNWLRELERWAPELVAVAVQGAPQSRRVLWRAFQGRCHVLLTTYDLVRQDRDQLDTREFDLIVADEIQRIKNPNAEVTKALRALRSKRRWGLTGTPLENSLEDVISIFRFLKPDVILGRLSAREVTDRIKPYFKRRRKDEVLPELPEKVLDSRWLALSEKQRAAYNRIETEGKSRLASSENVTLTNVLALILELKKICNFDPVSGESTKLEFLVEDYLPEACTDGQKALVISQYVQTLERIQKGIEDYEPLIYTGALSTAQRNKVLSDFDSKEHHRVLLLSLRAGGVGINLTRANYVVHFDRWWNPAVERQAEDRAHRIGQEKTVFVTRFICKDTIEERIEKILERKRSLFRDVVDELAEVDDLERVLSEEELFGLFGLEPRRYRSKETEPRATPSKGTKAKPSSGSQSDRDTRSDRVIRPDEPFSNLVRLRKVLRETEEFIEWADLHFSARGLEEIAVTVDPAAVRAIRILSGTANVNDRARKDFERFCAELKQKGIAAEWRTLTDFAHDRFIITKNACYNVPPINSLLKGSYSEILETLNRPPFDEWWKKASPI